MHGPINIRYGHLFKNYNKDTLTGDLLPDSAFRSWFLKFWHSHLVIHGMKKMDTCYNDWLVISLSPYRKITDNTLIRPQLFSSKFLPKSSIHPPYYEWCRTVQDTADNIINHKNIISMS